MTHPTQTIYCTYRVEGEYFLSTNDTVQIFIVVYVEEEWVSVRMGVYVPYSEREREYVR